MPSSPVRFITAAEDYFKLGWVTTPLALDANGLAKRPITIGWTSIPYTWPVIAGQEWEYARGIGIVLGWRSHNLAVIDIDDIDLAADCFAVAKDTRCIRTVRGRGHIYYVTTAHARSISIPVTFGGETVKIELKADGTQVAAPPTPGYTVIHDLPPKRVDSLTSVWEQIALQVGIESGVGTSDFPTPWQPKVEASERNKAAYVEAHALRKAEMPLPTALRYMAIRWREDYQQGDQPWEEIERTIRSAYRKARGKGAFYATKRDA